MHWRGCGFFATTRPRPPVFSHWSALLVHGLPLLGPPPRLIHVLGPSATPTDSHGIVSHPRGDAAVVEVRGLLVTSLTQTVADIAARASLMDGVVVADATLSRVGQSSGEPVVSHEDVVAAADALPPSPGARRAAAVVRFADGRAESPLESVSRVSLGLAGAPPPDLQVSVGDLLGFRARLDFVWPRLGVVGEADGAIKYTRPALRQGRTARDVFEFQNERERLIRSMGLSVFRWGWATGTRPDRMRAAAKAIGIPLESECTITGLDAPSASENLRWA